MIYLYEKSEKEREKKNPRRDTVLAQKVLLEGLKREYGIEVLPEIVRQDNGKPCFFRESHIFFNYSHCPGGILCAIGKAPVGADMENLRELRKGLEEYICHPQELEYLEEQASRTEALTALWCAKEAWGKYLGTGIRQNLRDWNMVPVLTENKAPQREVFPFAGKKGTMRYCVFAGCREDLELVEIKAL